MTITNRFSKKKGKQIYYYSLMIKGKRYSGSCDGCNSKREAEKYELMIRKQIELKTYQASTSSPIAQIEIKGAYEYSLKIPTSRPSISKRREAKGKFWDDFVAFMDARYPAVHYLTDVKKKHATEYLQYLKKNGRFCDKIYYQRKGKSVLSRTTSAMLSPGTINDYHTSISQVFKLCIDDSSFINPFSIPKMHNSPQTREIFTEDEIKCIMDNLDDFTKPLFVVAFATALRVGDICLLKKENIDLTSGVISLTMHKTTKSLQIPMLQWLKEYFAEVLCQSNESDGEYAEYVFPKLAATYLHNSSSISSRVKKFLENLGIITATDVPGRSRKHSLKGLHSCRHTFCYYAGLSGVPLLVVQSIVGHMSGKMTELYWSHANISDKRKALEQMPEFMKQLPNLSRKPLQGTSEPSDSLPPVKDLLNSLRNTLSLEEIAQLKEML